MQTQKLHRTIAEHSTMALAKNKPSRLVSENTGLEANKKYSIQSITGHTSTIWIHFVHSPISMNLWNCPGSNSKLTPTSSHKWEESRGPPGVSEVFFSKTVSAASAVGFHVSPPWGARLASEASAAPRRRRRPGCEKTFRKALMKENMRSMLWFLLQQPFGEFDFSGEKVGVWHI